ncbi:hypothetical protein DP124_13470 [Clostridium tetani]|uniref:hypothetical protein n=1 Tax=Clostridium tetani TaxID=1513 RepID=UPI00100C1261|nr:hypothetical protein [Clostridium tetani]RXI49167.1 hypothetical protein DP124_13470 [Clostridium tetani]
MIIIKQKIIIAIFIALIALISLFIYHGKNNEKIDIYDTVKETFLTDKGYYNELSKYVSENVFKHTNIYTVYELNNPKYNKPFKINFNLKEKSQNKKNKLIFVKMIYTVEINDSQNKTIGGSYDVPITFTVKNENGNWYIISKEEEA